MSMEISADGNVSIPGGATHPDFRLNVAGKVNAVEYYQKGHPYLPGIQGTFQRFYNEGNGAYRDCRHAWGKASCGLTAGGSPGGCQPGFSPYTLMTAYDRDPVCKGGDCHVALVGCAR